MTEREQLAARARAAGLRLSQAELDHLRKAWKRYLALVTSLRESLLKADRLDGG